MHDTWGTIYRYPFLLFISILLWPSAQTLADDVEIFVNTGDQEISCAAPNILFIIDTSASMDTKVFTQAPWDPTENYSGCFDSSRIYYLETATTPDCDTKTSFRKSNNFCQASFLSTEYTGLFQAWNEEREAWERIPDDNDSMLIECAADAGVHGGENDEKTYAADGGEGNKAWSNDAKKRISWGANSTAATLHDGNWLNWQQTTPETQRTRLDIVKEVVNSTLNNMGDAHVGIMRFNNQKGGSVIAPVKNINGTRDQLKQTVNNLQPNGFTPLSETLFEAGQYLAGRLVHFGDKDNHIRSHAASRIGNSLSSDRYLSPLTAADQNNYIVLLTDGEPSKDTNANNKIEALPGYAGLVDESCNHLIEGDCLDKMANYLYLADLRSDLPGKQNVITHTIGFNADFKLLKDTAARGGGKYFIADNTTTLTQGLADLVKVLSRKTSLFMSPTISINNFSRTERINEVYLSLFKPQATHHWPGNLKKYRLIDTANGALLVGANGQPVLTPDGSYIDKSAVSFWSAPLVDGADVQLGGAASLLPDPDSRNLLTNASGGTTLSSLNTGNSAITATLLGSPEAERNAVISWARGLDAHDNDTDTDNVNDDLAINLRHSMGDSLHAQPVIGNYNETEDKDESVVFIATNDGYLHAIDARLGKEIWAFVPQRLLKRLHPLSLNEAAQNKQYGLDGELVLITKEKDGKPETLLFGMRRGGEALYSMDVSNSNAPRLNWIIDSSMPDFLDMGQSWSPPVVKQIKVGSQVRSVAIFGGGYDPGQDNRDFRFDTKGNAIYFVDLETGEVIWSAGSSETGRSDHDLLLERMNFAIPAGIRVIDQNQDGYADRMYVGDMGGQVWRFDIIPGNNPSSLVEGGVLASLGAADSGTSPPPATDLRRFYNTPDIVNVITDKNIFLSINIGSGYRAHPLDTSIYDEFFSIRDFHSTEVIPKELYASQDFPLITRNDLTDITNTATTTLQPSDLGWRLGMVQNNGEKILGESLTIDNVLFFNSFAPLESVQPCSPGSGINRNYRVSIIDGSALTNLDHSSDEENLTAADRFIKGAIGAPVPGPAYDPDMLACSGLDCLNGKSEFLPETSTDGEDIDTVRDIVNETYWYPVEATD